MQYLPLALRCLIGATFLVASASKVSGGENFRRFVDSLETMRVVRPSRVRPVAVVVVALETCVCVLMVVPRRGPGIAGFLLAAGLLSAFAGGIAVSMRKGVRAPCRCFGPSSAPLGGRHLTRNLLLAAGAVAGALLTAGGNVERMRPEGAVAAAGIGLALAALVATLDEIAALFGAATRPSGSR